MFSGRFCKTCYRPLRTSWTRTRKSRFALPCIISIAARKVSRLLAELNLINADALDTVDAERIRVQWGDPSYAIRAASPPIFELSLIEFFVPPGIDKGLRPVLMSICGCLYPQLILPRLG